MINVKLILTQLEEALRGVNAASASRLSEDDRIAIAEMIINLQMQLDMVGPEAHEQFDSRLEALKAAAASAGIVWRIS